MAVQGGAGTEALTCQGLTERGKETESKAQKQVVGGDRKPASRSGFGSTSDGLGPATGASPMESRVLGNQVQPHRRASRLAGTDNYSLH
ncbi:hypothetical protein Celaphus_00007615 [Cervus elaphus hippelaphus]|uniref:Uncharacterized protein n=1 Tax=Cervus elaphus hippelaphus TaxID=46360 RepID=A0A212CAJ1_CEREH|nr:hypothetical protein Celaphus_00007615 [Cervus elaphus hippelaphus]